MSARKKNAYGSQFINIKRDVRVLDISCAKYHAVAVTTSGDVYTWGRQKHQQQHQDHFDRGFQSGLSGMPKLRQAKERKGKQQYFQAKAQESSTYFEFSPPKLVSALRGKRVVKTSAGGDYTARMGVYVLGNNRMPERGVTPQRLARWPDHDLVCCRPP